MASHNPTAGSSNSSLPSYTLSPIPVFDSSLEFLPSGSVEAPARRLWSARATRGKNRSQKSNERRRRNLAAASADAEEAREQALRSTVRQAEAVQRLAQTELELARSREQARRARGRALAAEQKFSNLERKTVERDLIDVRSRICASSFLADSLQADAPPP